MLTCLIEPTDKTYKICDGSMQNRKKAYLADEPLISKIKIVEDICCRQIIADSNSKNDYPLSDCKIRWMGFWDNKLQIGYQGTHKKDKKQVLGKQYFPKNNPDLNSLIALIKSLPDPH